jgi:hypothetical protein
MWANIFGQQNSYARNRLVVAVHESTHDKGRQPGAKQPASRRVVLRRVDAML